MTTPQHLSDRYELGEILGFGGMSEVHLARDVRLHRDVAVKVLRADLARDPSFYLRFRREAQNAAALNHPAIVAVYDTGEAETATGPLPYIVMEYVDGITLRDIVHTEGPIEPRRAIEIIADACQALNFSHQHGTIHRDVKPANIMISKGGAVKVMDFGIAKALADAGNSVTQTAAVIGTAQYLSPEQARGETVDARSDVYSLGCVLYEILTGEPPFVGDSPVAVAYQHVREDPVAPSTRHSGISPELDAVVLKALTKNPENRYQTAAEMRTDLIRVHSGEAPDAPKVLTEAERTSLLAPSGRGRSSRNDAIPAHRAGPAEPEKRASVARWLVAVAVLAVLTVVVTLAINMIGSNPRDQQVPDVTGKSRDDAIATLQNRGFKVNPMLRDDPKVLPGYVISTDPTANTSVAAGDEITINVSGGPKQAQVPDCRTFTFPACQTLLKQAGFTAITQQGRESSVEQKDDVVDTIPAPNTTAPLTNPITVFVGMGPGDATVPPVTGQQVDSARAVLTAAGFTNLVDVPTDSFAPAGQVLGTVPAAGEQAAKDAPVQIQKSKGNQIQVPPLSNLFYGDAVQLLQGLGFKKLPLNGGDVPVTRDQDRARVLKQDPPAGTGLSADGTITLYFGAT